MKTWHAAPLPANEEQRLRLLRSIDVLDTPAEEVFDRITRVAAELLQVPMIVVSLVDEHRQWFKSRVGIEVCETTRDVSFCSHAVYADTVLVVEDAFADERFAHNPLVTGAPFVRFYAGVPLRSAQGLVLGTLCAIDTRPRTLSDKARAALCDLAATVERELVQRELALESREAQEHDRRRLRLSETRFQTIFQQTPTGKAIVGLDGRFIEVNPKMCEITGYSAAELLQMSFQEITEEEDLAADLELVGELLAGKRQTYSLEKRYRKRDGGTVWVHLSVAMLRDHDGTPTHFVSVLQDITSRKHSEQLLRDYQQELERRVLERTGELTKSRTALQTITDNLPILIAHIDANLCYRFNNEVYREVFGVDPMALRGKPVRETVGEELFARLSPLFRRALAGERVTHEDIVYNAESGRVWSATYVPDRERGEVVGFYVMSQDITERKQRENQMHSEIMLDALTGMPNRRALHEQLTCAVQSARDGEVPFALFFMDLDGFKAVNDQYGHDAGDALLRQVAQRLRRATRATDLVCRLAGDEFVLLARDIASASACSRIAQDICRAIRKPFELSQGDVQLGASVGIAMCAAGYATSTETMLAEADRAMYEAKRKGRNGFRFAPMPADAQAFIAQPEGASVQAGA